MKANITVLGGDGIGPEVMAEVKKIIAWMSDRRGLRFDVASGDSNEQSPTLNTFNPLFPSGVYFNLANPVGPSNIIDLHPTLDLTLTDGSFTATKPSDKGNIVFTGRVTARNVTGDRDFLRTGLRTGVLDEGRIAAERTVVTELWTFVRAQGGRWLLSAIQQTG